MENTVKPKNIEHEFCKNLVGLFLKPLDSSLWGRELKLAKKLYRQNTDFGFWTQLAEFNRLEKKLPSLAFFLTEKGIEMIRKEDLKNSLVLPEGKKYNLEEIEGADKNPVTTKKNKKSNTILEFLNN